MCVRQVCAGLLFLHIYNVEVFQIINQMHYEDTVNLILFRKKLSSPKLNIIQWHGWTGSVGLSFQNCKMQKKKVCFGGVWVYTRHKFRNECKRLCFCWKVEHRTLEKTFLFPKNWSSKAKITPSILKSWRNFQKKYLSICANMKLFFLSRNYFTDLQMKKWI